VATESPILFHQKLQAGQQALDRGQYRQSIEELQNALQYISLGSKPGGEAQLWLVMAYQAAGQISEARNLCRKLTRHPHPDLRKQSKQILYILEAPRLARPREWMTEIPDLTRSEEQTPRYAASRRSRKSAPEPSPIVFEDTRRMNTQDNGFIVVTLVLILLIVGSTLWFS